MGSHKMLQLRILHGLLKDTHTHVSRPPNIICALGRGHTYRVKSFIPHQRTKSRDPQPGISPDLKRIIRCRDKAFKTSKKKKKKKKDTWQD